MGNFVADFPIESLVAPLPSCSFEEKDALADIFETRKLIEPQIADWRQKERPRKTSIA